MKNKRARILIVVIILAVLFIYLASKKKQKQVQDEADLQAIKKVQQKAKSYERGEFVKFRSELLGVQELPKQRADYIEWLANKFAEVAYGLKGANKKFNFAIMYFPKITKEKYNYDYDTQYSHTDLQKGRYDAFNRIEKTYFGICLWRVISKNDKYDNLVARLKTEYLNLIGDSAKMFNEYWRTLVNDMTELGFATDSSLKNKQ